METRVHAIGILRVMTQVTKIELAMFECDEPETLRDEVSRLKKEHECYVTIDKGACLT